MHDEVWQLLSARSGIAYGVNELARYLDMPPSTVQRQLNKLYEDGKVAKTKKRVYYVAFEFEQGPPNEPVPEPLEY